MRYLPGACNGMLCKAPSTAAVEVQVFIAVHLTRGIDHADVRTKDSRLAI